MLELFDCTEIADFMADIANEKPAFYRDDRPEINTEELEDGLYWLKAAAQNRYNKDYFRTVWNCLQLILENRLYMNPKMIY